MPLRTRHEPKQWKQLYEATRAASTFATPFAAEIGHMRCGFVRLLEIGARVALLDRILANTVDTDAALDGRALFYPFTPGS